MLYATCAFTFLAAFVSLCFASQQRDYHANVPVAVRQQGRIVGGSPANKFYRRHLAHLFISNNNGDSFGCTGTVIGRKWVLTAAHCVSQSVRLSISPSESYAYIGIKTAFDSSSKKAYYMKTVYVHKKYKPGNPNNDYRHDIAVVELKDRIKSSQYYPVKLSSAPSDKTVVTAVGYGVLNEDQKPASQAMQVRLLALPFSTCTSYESSTDRRFLRNRLQVCASSVGFPTQGGTDTCRTFHNKSFCVNCASARLGHKSALLTCFFQLLLASVGAEGDSGGPLFYVEHGIAVQYAITSFSNFGCARAAGPAWYTRVSTYGATLQTLMETGKPGKLSKIYT